MKKTTTNEPAFSPTKHGFGNVSESIPQGEETLSSRTNVFAHLLRVAHRSVQERGFFLTLRQGPKYVATFVKRRRAWRKVEGEDIFDQTFGTDTTATLQPEDFASTSPNLRHAQYYRATPSRMFDRIMDALSIRHEDFVFIDFGSGKARTLFLADKFPFKRLIGVELSPRLHAIAQKNVEIYQSKTQKSDKFEVVCADAASYDLPIENSVFYFFDPFNLPVMSAVLQNIRQSLEKHPRKIFIVYVNPNQSGAMRQSDFLECVYAFNPDTLKDTPEHLLSIPWNIYANRLYDEKSLRG